MGAKRRRIFEPQTAYHREMRQERIRRVGRFLLSVFVIIIGLFGLSAVFGSIFVGWLDQPQFILNLPLCITGIAIMALSALTLYARKKRGFAILLALATGLELMLWAEAILSDDQFGVIGALAIVMAGLYIGCVLFNKTIFVP